MMIELKFSTLVCIILYFALLTNISDTAKGHPSRFSYPSGATWVEGKGWKYAIKEYIAFCVAITVIIKGGIFVVKFLMNNVTVVWG